MLTMAYPQVLAVAKQENASAECLHNFIPYMHIQPWNPFLRMNVLL